MEDIIFSEPWMCGERDCEQQWHLSNWWVYDDGTYSEDKYADGDHEDRTEADLPTLEAVDEAWLEYWKYVQETGTDPLNQIMLPGRDKIKRVWQCRYRTSIAGVLGVGLRPRARGEWLPPSDVPEAVRQYFLLEPRPGAAKLYGVQKYKNIEAMHRELSDKEQEGLTIRLDKRLGLLVTSTVELDPPPLPEERIKAHLRKVARQAIKEIN